MLRPVANPPNPYLSEQREWLEPPPNAKVEVYEETSKSILSENDSPDLPFRWSLNPYRGCQHACAYCYARPTHEYLGLGAGTDFDTKLVAKVNAPELLRAAFSRRGWEHERVCFSGVTDCYQPIEASYRLTRQCIEVCLDFSNPASIITKGCLIRRDIDVLSALNRKARVSVYQSIPFADDATARLIEPQVPPPSKRFEVMKALREAGITVGVMVSPVIPGLNDTQIPLILRYAAEAGATSAAYTALHLPRNSAPVFIERIQQAMPDRAARIEARVREMRNGKLNDSAFGARMRGEGPYWSNIEALFRVSAAKYGIDVPRRPAAEKNHKPRRDRPDQGLKGPVALPLFHDDEPPRRRTSQMEFDFGE